jgi:DNA-binding FadR family transcriptional regulator
MSDPAELPDRPVETRNKAEAAAHVLRSEIASGVHPIGANLPPEAELLRRFGMSRPSFREALRILESEGIIRVNRGPRGGALVLKPEIGPIARSVGMLLELHGATLQDIFRVRALIEPEAARSIALARDNDALAALAQVAAAQRFTLHEPASFKREELRFRAILVDHARSVTLKHMANLLNHVFEQKMLALPAVAVTEDTQAELRRGVRAKEKLIEVMHAGDADAAERIWRDYVTAYASRLFLRIGRLTGDAIGA